MDKLLTNFYLVFMKVLHTADWHIGQLLHSRKRYDEHEKFLEWLVTRIRRRFLRCAAYRWRYL